MKTLSQLRAEKNDQAVSLRSQKESGCTAPMTGLDCQQSEGPPGAKAVCPSEQVTRLAPGSLRETQAELTLNPYKLEAGWFSPLGTQSWLTAPISSPDSHLNELQVREGPHGVVRTVRRPAGAIGWLGLQVVADGLERRHRGLVTYQKEQSVVSLVGTTAPPRRSTPQITLEREHGYKQRRTKSTLPPGRGLAGVGASNRDEAQRNAAPSFDSPERTKASPEPWAPGSPSPAAKPSPALQEGLQLTRGRCCQGRHAVVGEGPVLELQALFPDLHLNPALGGVGKGRKEGQGEKQMWTDYLSCQERAQGESTNPHCSGAVGVDDAPSLTLPYFLSKWEAPGWAPSYLQDENEIVHRLAALVQVMVCSQAVTLVKPHFLVDAGMLQQVQQDLLGDAQGAEHIHLCPVVGKRDSVHRAQSGLHNHTRLLLPPEPGHLPNTREPAGHTPACRGSPEVVPARLQRSATWQGGAAPQVPQDAAGAGEKQRSPPDTLPLTGNEGTQCPPWRPPAHCTVSKRAKKRPTAPLTSGQEALGGQEQLR